MLVQFYDYAVIGTGPLGLIAANIFAHSKKRVLLIGPSFTNSVPSFKYLALSGATWHFLEQHGYDSSQFFFEPIQSLILGRPEKKGWRFFAKHKKLLGCNIRQDQLLQTLWSLRHTDIHHETSLLENVSKLPDEGYQLLTQSGHSYVANRLIATDGAYSRVRLSLKTPWDFFKKSLSVAKIFQIASSYEFDSEAAYQYAENGCTIAVLPHSHHTKYCVATGPERLLINKYQGTKIVPLWNYQVQWEREDCAYLGWAGQSFDPNTASGLNHAIWELNHLYQYWNTESYSGKWKDSWKNKINHKRAALRSLIAWNKVALPAIHLSSPIYVKTLLEQMTGESLMQESCYCPRAIL